MINRVVYVCGRCGGAVVCVYTTEDGVDTAHVFCEKCDEKALESGRTEPVSKIA